MAEHTNISWTDHTYNPWIGCTKVSDGCRVCYAERETKRMGVVWGPTGDRVRTSENYWKQPLAWNRKAIRDGVRRRVFCASLADVFEEIEALDPWREDLFTLINSCPSLEWLLLTKRIENVERMVPATWLLNWPDHIRIGTTAENQEMADKRIPILLNLTAKYGTRNFVSFEPLLGPITLPQQNPDGFWPPNLPQPERPWLPHRSWPDDYQYWQAKALGIHWGIVGGESGSKARVMNVDWALSLHDQFLTAGVPFFMKQDSGYKPGLQGRIPDKFYIREFPNG